MNTLHGSPACLGDPAGEGCQLTASSLSLKVLGAFKEEEWRQGLGQSSHLPLSQVRKPRHRVVSLPEITQLSGAAGTLAPQ